MLDRIRQLLANRNLSSTQFADAIGVSRPIISHILSGRNKPSLEVVQKILSAFPDTSTIWLLNGTGPMKATSSAAREADVPKRRVVPELPSVAIPTPEPQIEPLRAFKDHPAAVTPAEPLQRTEGAKTAPILNVANVALAPQPIAEPASAPPAMPPVAAGTSQPATNQPVGADWAQALAEPGKVIRRIVIFYQDGTFADYQPEVPINSAK